MSAAVVLDPAPRAAAGAERSAADDVWATEVPTP